MIFRSENRRDISITTLIIAAFFILGAMMIIFGVLAGGISPRNPMFFFGLFMLTVPPSVIKYWEYRRFSKMEREFPDFLRDLVEQLRAGMAIPQALRVVSKNDYGPLSKEIKKMVSQMSWKLTFEEAMLRFLERCKKSKIISQSILVILEAQKSGGKIDEVLEGVAAAVRRIDELEKEHRSKLRIQIITQYFVFYSFLIVIILLKNILLPSLAGSPEEYELLFFHLILIQAFFAGLLAGRIAEKSFIAGLKHSCFLIFSGYLIFVISNYFT